MCKDHLPFVDADDRALENGDRNEGGGNMNRERALKVVLVLVGLLFVGKREPEALWTRRS
jgi:hypothetical protein